MSAHRTLATAGLVVSGMFLISRVLGWVRTFVIVDAFGVGRDLDIFNAAFRLPDLIFQLVAAGALSSALIPVVSGLLASDEESRAFRVVSTVTNVMLALLLALAVVAFFLAPVIVPAITPGFVPDPDKMTRTIELTRIMLLSPIFLAVGAVATSLLNARGRFAASAIAPIVYNIAIIGGALLLKPSLGVAGLAVSVVLGSLSHVLVQVPSILGLGYRYRLKVDIDDPQARRALTLMVPRAIGLGVTQITFIVATAIATDFGDGALSAYQLAFVLLQIPLGVIGVPLGVVMLPALSREAATGNVVGFAGLVSRALRLLLFVMLPIAGLGIVLAGDLVHLLFGGGRSSPATLDQTAATLVTFLLGLAAHALIAVLARAFYAQQDTRTPVAAGIVAVAFNTTLAIVLTKQAGLGLPGIGLAIAIGAWIEAILLLVLLKRRTPELAIAPIGLVAVRSLAATAVASLVTLAIAGGLGLIGSDEPTKPVLLVRMTIAGGVGLLTYLGLAAVLRIPELPSIVGVMVDLVRRPRQA
jgi:putative peptidoglycan lipid II flippase